MLIAAYLGLVCLQSCMRVYTMMFRKRKRESGAVLQLAAEKGQRSVTEALLGC
jgi:hypothetical protein